MIVPPLPRYLFTGCCEERGHCPNVGAPDHANNLLSSVICQRNHLIKLLLNAGLADFTVMDSCCMTDCNQTSPCSSRVEALKHVTARDGIHLNLEGYKLMAKNLISEAVLLQRSDRQSTLPAKPHYWRGFKSQAGSCVLTGGGGCSPVNVVTVRQNSTTHTKSVKIWLAAVAVSQCLSKFAKVPCFFNIVCIKPKRQ